MKINKNIYNSVQEDSYKKDEKKLEKKDIKEGAKEDRVEITSHVSEIKTVDLNSENSPERSYIQLKYAEYKIKENADTALAIYNGLSKERVYGLL